MSGHSDNRNHVDGHVHSSEQHTQDGDSGETPIMTTEQLRNIMLMEMAGIMRGVSSVPVRSPHKNLSAIARKAGASEFSGASGIEACDAEFWMVKVKRIFDELEFSTAEKFRCATALLQDEAYQWWSSVVPHVPAAKLDWEFFESSFKAKYIGSDYYEQRRREFMNLTQGDMTIKEYEHEFTRLSTYAPELVSTEEMMCEKFMYGLRNDLYVAMVAFNDKQFSDLRTRVNKLDAAKKRTEDGTTRSQLPPKSPFKKPSDSVHPSASIHRPSNPPQFKKASSHRSFSGNSDSRSHRSVTASAASPDSSVKQSSATPCPTCFRFHSGVCWKEIGACFKCGSTEHYFRDCPRAVAPATTQRSAPVPSGGRGQRTTPGSSGRTEVMVPARTYAIGAREETTVTDVNASET